MFTRLDMGWFVKRQLRTTGFTLIELLTTMAVTGILLGIAVPNFTTFIENSRARSDVQALKQSLVAAKSEAVARTSVVNVTATGGDWTKGWRSWVDLNADGALDDNEVIKTVDGIKSGAGISMSQSGSAITVFSFDANGFLLGAVPVSISYRTSPEHCARDRDIQISASGQVRATERNCS
jgi:type IV fimbrial biogenesis protein FimT